MIITHCPECTILSSINEYSSSLKAESSQQVTSIGSSSVELSVSSTLSLVESTASSDCLSQQHLRLLFLQLLNQFIL